jgi:hypothetical protein
MHILPHWQRLWTNHKNQKEEWSASNMIVYTTINMATEICNYEIHSQNIVLVLILQAFSHKQCQIIVTVRWEFHSVLPQLPAGMSHYNFHQNEHIPVSFRHWCSIDRRLYSIQTSLLDTPSKGVQVNSFPNNCVFNPTRNPLHWLSFHHDNS